MIHHLNLAINQKNISINVLDQNKRNLIANMIVKIYHKDIKNIIKRENIFQNLVQNDYHIFNLKLS